MTTLDISKVRVIKPPRKGMQDLIIAIEKIVCGCCGYLKPNCSAHAINGNLTRPMICDDCFWHRKNS